jgi:hypothetical protein
MKSQTELELPDKAKTNGVAIMSELSNYQALENFTKIVNAAPPPSSLQKTPDGKAETMGISFVETKLDEIYLRQWGTEDVHVMQVANEILVWLTLWVIDPLTKLKITRAGFAAVQIMTDACPDELKSNYKAKYAWSLDMQNKKPNAMYLAFPKGRSMAIKNAAVTLGKAFGRDLNRKFEDTHEDFYANLMNDQATLGNAIAEMKKATTADQFKVIWDSFPELQASTDFKKEFLFYQRSNIKK